MKEIYKIKTNGNCNPRAIIQGEKYRISLLTEGLIRLEYSEAGKFEDRATKTVINRNFDVPEFKVFEEEDSLEIITRRIHLIYDKKEFTDRGLSIEVRGNTSAYHSIWHFGQEPTDLRGTARTLDEADGSPEQSEEVV